MKGTITTILLDPCDHYSKEDFRYSGPPGKWSIERCLIEACGLIPSFVNGDDASIRDNLNANYPFGIRHVAGASVDEQGIHTYPEDPPLYPYMRIDKGDETLWIYPSAICAIHEADGSWFHTRIE